MQSSKILNLLVKIITTFFGAGFFPLVPGTFASMVGVFLFYLIKGRPVLYISLTFILIILGFWLSGKAERLFARKDARCIVIDEVAGVLLCFMNIAYDVKLLIVAFILFRILDALKPFPAARLEHRRGSIGIMADDIVAGIYTNIILQIVLLGSPLLRLYK